MTSKLFNLDPTIIGQILSYNDTSHCSLPLWLTGNGAIHKSLCKGVYFVELCNERQFDLCFIPKYLTNLRSLRHLIIDRCDNSFYRDVYDHERCVSIIQALPKTMESIILRFRHSTSIFFQEKGTSTPFVDVRSTFPTLKRLHLDMTTYWIPHNFLWLPASVTDLHILLPKELDAVLPLIQAIPPSMEALTLHSRHHDFEYLPAALWANLPPQLTRLHITAYIRYTTDGLPSSNLASLPRNLTNLEIDQIGRFHQGLRAISGESTYDTDPMVPNFPVMDWKTTSSADMPQFISSLSITSFVDKKIATSLSTLSTHLKSLVLPYRELIDVKILRILPRRLTFLSASFSGLSDLKDGDFPSTLRRLHTHTRKGDPFESSKVRALLPPLIEFSININTPTSIKTINNLPKTVKSLSFGIDAYDGEFEFPPQLTTLTLMSSPSIVLGIPSPKDQPKLKKTTQGWSGAQSAPDLARGSVVYNCIRIDQVPIAVTTLLLQRVCIPSSQLVHLPPHLTRLQIDYIARDDLFDPTSSECLAKARYLLQLEGGEDKNYNFCLSESDTVPAVTILDLLPRALTKLSLDTAENLTDIACSRLPKNLVELSLLPKTPLPSSAIRFIPSSKLTSLSLALTILKDADLKALPPRLRKLSTLRVQELHFSWYAIDDMPLLEGFERSARDTISNNDFWDQWYERNTQLINASGARDAKRVKSLRTNWKRVEGTIANTDFF